ncbi:MAG: diacylglycerol kinase family protein [Candidatus Peribacteraceae bacterium]|nr:diacylglycerol kinase family protein [Candidatus Peribacteraceae bacterium]
MKRAHQSLRHALHGLHHAVAAERNLRLFLGTYTVVLILAEIENIPMIQWLLLIVSGALFLAIELINTALERLVDTCDELWRKIDTKANGHHMGLKLTKDVASAASLISLCLNVVVILSIFLPLMVQRMI